MQNSYIWFNGEYHRSDNPVLNIGNRAFRYGDGLFETIHCYGTDSFYLDFHYKRLTKGLQLLEIEKPYSLSQVKLSEVITKLLNKNRHFGSTRVRVLVFRNDGGLYTPENNSASVIVESSPLDFKFYQYNQQGLMLDIYDDIAKPVNILSSVKSCNALLYVKAGLYMRCRDAEQLTDIDTGRAPHTPERGVGAKVDPRGRLLSTNNVAFEDLPCSAAVREKLRGGAGGRKPGAFFALGERAQQVEEV